MSKTHRRQERLTIQPPKPRNQELSRVLSGRKGGPMADKRAKILDQEDSRDADFFYEEENDDEE